MKSRIFLPVIAAAAMLTVPALAAPPATTTAAPAAQTAPAAQAAPAGRSASHSSNAASTHRSMRNTNVALYRRAQERLKQLNLYSGPTDGSRNANYVSALERFQRDHNIPANGRLNAQTRSALGMT